MAVRILTTRDIRGPAWAKKHPEQAGDLWEIRCEPEHFEAVKAALAEAEIATQVAELSMIPSTSVTLDAANGRKVLKLMDAFEDHDDVQNVYSNFDMPDEVMAQLAGEA